MEVKELEFFKRQVESNIIKARSGIVVLMPFLDETKQSIITNYKIKDIDIIFKGGFKNSEYNRCCFMPKNYDICDFKIIVYEKTYNKRYLELTHRNILGSLMSLGIKRESIGDIVIEKGKAYFACTREISEYIVNSYKTISNVAIELKECKEEISISKELISKAFIVSSMRIDVLVAAICKISRSEAANKITDGLISINHITCNSSSHIVKEKDLISIKHKGRIYVEEIGGKTRNDRQIIKLGFLK